MPFSDGKVMTSTPRELKFEAAVVFTSHSFEGCGTKIEVQVFDFACGIESGEKQAKTFHGRRQPI